MRQRLVVISDAQGVPRVEVPFSSMWDLVEYLSYQRAAVSYQYQATHFLVTFSRADTTTAQRVLDEWVNAHMLQTA